MRSFGKKTNAASSAFVFGIGVAIFLVAIITRDILLVFYAITAFSISGILILNATEPTAEKTLDGVNTRDPRDVQAYLKDVWEQRMEQETGAAVFRAAINHNLDVLRRLDDITKDELIHVVLTQSYSYSRGDLSGEILEHVRRIARTYDAYQADKIMNDRNSEAQRLKSQTQELRKLWNRAMGRPESGELLTYAYPPDPDWTKDKAEIRLDVVDGGTLFSQRGAKETQTEQLRSTLFSRGTVVPVPMQAEEIPELRSYRADNERLMDHIEKWDEQITFRP